MSNQHINVIIHFFSGNGTHSSKLITNSLGVTQAFFYFNLFELFLIRLRICYHVIYYFIRCVSMSLFSCHMFTIECVSLYNLRMLWFSLYSDSSVNSSSLNVCTLLRKYVVGKNHLPRYMAAIKAPRNKKKNYLFHTISISSLSRLHDLF